VAKRNVTKEKATPARRSAGFLPCEFALDPRGRSTAHPCAGVRHARIVRASLRAIPQVDCRLAGAPVGGHPGHGLGPYAFIMRCRGTRHLLNRVLSARKTPWFVPSNAVGHGSKAPLFEATDGRVGAGPWTV